MKMKEVKVAIVGSRTFNSYDDVNTVMSTFISSNDVTITEIVSGGAKGADALGERYAEIHNIPTKIYYADWKKFGRRAGPIRNVDIINRCDACVAFWDGESHGTKHDINLCREKHKLCIIFNYITKETIIEKNNG